MPEPTLPRLAYCSPLPPRSSGIADYGVLLLPALARHFAIELYTEDGRVADPALERAFPSFPLTRLAPARFDGAVLYHIGNDARMHGELYRRALETPGIVVLHEYMLHHLVRHLALRDGGPQAYMEEMHYAYGRGGRTTAKRFLEIGAGRDLWAYPLFERLIDRSRGAIVHNHSARRRIRASRPEARVVVVPHPSFAGAGAADDADRRRLRAALGLPEDALVIGSFGFMTGSKRLDVSLRAFAALRRRRPDAIYVLVGDASGHRDLDMLLSGAQGQGVRVTGRVALDVFLDYMRVSDVAINLRDPSGGETSGTLMRLLGLGRAVIVSDGGSFAELPDDCCVKIACDRRADGSLLAALLALADDPGLRRRLGDNARRHVTERHGLAEAARAYAAAVSTILDTPAPGATPPLPDTRGIAAVLATDVGAALHTLGVDEHDDDALEAVARTLVDLGLA